MLDDPDSPAIVRPQLSQGSSNLSSYEEDVPFGIAPRQVTLRDRVTTATLVPFTSSPDQVPPGLLSYLCDQLNREIEKGDTYPMIEPLPVSKVWTVLVCKLWCCNAVRKYRSSRGRPRGQELECRMRGKFLY